MCFVFIWEQTATCATYIINWLVFIAEMKSVYCAVRTGSLNKAVCTSYLKGSLFGFTPVYRRPVICVHSDVFFDGPSKVELLKTTVRREDWRWRHTDTFALPFLKWMSPPKNVRPSPKTAHHLWLVKTLVEYGFAKSAPLPSYCCTCHWTIHLTAKLYTGCPGGNVPDFGRMFLTLKYTDITQNTYIRSRTVTEIMAREVWKCDSCYTLIDYQIHIKTGRNM